METNQNEQDQTDLVNQTYAYAAHLLVNEKKSSIEVIDLLKEKGMDAKSAYEVVETLEEQIREAKKERANKDLLHGILWCAGGTIATLAHIGFIFWGAILFGAIQFFKGVASSID